MLSTGHIRTVRTRVCPLIAVCYGPSSVESLNGIFSAAGRAMGLDSTGIVGIAFAADYRFADKRPHLEGVLGLRKKRAQREAAEAAR